MRARGGGLWLGVAAVLTVAIVAGSWMVQRGLLFAPPQKHVASSQLFADVFAHVKREYVDTLADSTLYADAATGAVAELDDPNSAYVSASVLALHPDTLSRITEGPVAARLGGAPRLQTLGTAAAYLPLPHLTDATVANFTRSVDSLQRAGVRQLLVDLRGTTDGSVAQAVGVARGFLNRGQVILRVRGRRAMDTATYSASDAQRWPGLRLALLADSSTAGAAEVLCGALQDHDRATIVGSHTIGIGGTPTVFHLQSGGALVLRTGAWVTPAGRPIQTTLVSRQDAKPRKPTVESDAGRKLDAGGGIAPDVLVAAPQGPLPASATPGNDPVVRAALAALSRTTA